MFWHDVELSESWFPLISMLSCVHTRAQLRLGSELEVGLLDLQRGVNACGIVSYTMRRFLTNMGTDMEPPVPHSVFERAKDDLVGTFGSAMKLRGTD